MAERTWTAAEAKAKFSEVLTRALSDGPQGVSKNGKPFAVIVSARQWAELNTARSPIDVLTDPKYGVLSEEEAEFLFQRDRTPDRPGPEF